MSEASSRTILFTAFEPSGDLLAARLIRELKQRDASLRFTGFGGPKMQEAGAELIQVTTEHASIALSHGLINEVQAHRARIKKLAGWLDENDILCHVPTDSPAANWALCKQVRKRRPSAKIVHLACPQIWGWATWRVHRLRRLTDRVLCLLPFEPDWLKQRDVDGVFVGHPVFEDCVAALNEPIDESLPEAGEGGIRLALMPGSRPGELTKNWGTMLRVWQQVKAKVPGLVGVVAARQAEDLQQLKAIAKEEGLEWPEDLTVVGNKTSSVLRWADVVLVKSGTSTLQVSSMGKPMVAFYNADPVKWHGLGRWIIKSRTFTLPNLIREWQSDKRAVPEFIPHFGDPDPIAAALLPVLTKESVRQAQQDELAKVNQAFAGVDFAAAAADGLLEVVNR